MKFYFGDDGRILSANASVRARKRLAEKTLRRFSPTRIVPFAHDILRDSSNNHHFIHC
jgi:hypothetical protein